MDFEKKKRSPTIVSFLPSGFTGEFVTCRRRHRRRHDAKTRDVGTRRGVRAHRSLDTGCIGFFFNIGGNAICVRSHHARPPHEMFFNIPRATARVCYDATVTLCVRVATRHRDIEQYPHTHTRTHEHTHTRAHTHEHKHTRTHAPHHPRTK